MALWVKRILSNGRSRWRYEWNEFYKKNTKNNKGQSPQQDFLWQLQLFIWQLQLLKHLLGWLILELDLQLTLLLFAKFLLLQFLLGDELQVFKVAVFLLQLFILHLLQFFNSLEGLLLKGNTSFKNYRLINNMTIMQKKLQNILRITVTKTFLIT